MPIFEHNNKKYNISDNEVADFANDYPEATSVYEANGRKYKINAGETGDFLKDFPDAKAYSEDFEMKPVGSAMVSESTHVTPEVKPLQVNKEALPKYKDVNAVVDAGEKLVEEDNVNLKAFENQLDTSIEDNKTALDGEKPKDGIVDHVRRGLSGLIPVGIIANSLYEYYGKRSEASRDLGTASDYLQDAKRLQGMSKAETEQGDWGCFFSSFGKTIADKSTLSFGLTDIDNDARMISVSKKMEERGYDSLSKSEQNLLQSAAIKTAAEAYYSSDIGVSQQAGQSTAASIPYMLQFLATGGVGGAATSGVKKAVMSVAKNMLKKGVDKSVTKIGAGIITNAAKAAAMTPLQPALYSDIAERMAGNASFDELEEGGVEFSGIENQTGIGEAAVKGYAATTIDNFSEMSGELLGGIGKIASKYGKKVPKLGGLIDRAEKNEILTGFNDFSKKIGWNGTVGEFFEEQVGTTLNTLTVGDSQIKDLIDAKQQLSTLVSVAAMGGFFTGVNAGGGALARRQIKKGYDKATDSLYETLSESGATEQDVLNLESQIANNTNEQNQALLEGMVDSGAYTQDQFNVITNYITRSTQYNSMIGGVKDQINERVEEENELIKQSSNPDMNAIVMVRLDDSGKDYRVTGGNVIMREDGSIDTDASSEMIYIETDEGKKPYYINNLFGLSSIVPLEDALITNEQQAREILSQQLASEIDEKPDMPFQQGAGVVYDGKEGLIQRITPEGTAVVVFSDGSGSIDASLDKLQLIKKEEEPAVGNDVSVDFVDPDSGAAEETSEMTLEKLMPTLPKTKDGKIDYKKLTIEQQFQYTSLTDGVDTAITDLENDISILTVDIEKLGEKASKARGSERISTREEIKQRSAELEELKGVLSGVKPTVKTEDTEVTSINPVQDVTVAEPQSQEEYARQLSTEGNDPLEIASLYKEEVKNAGYESLPLPWQQQLIGRKINRASFDRFGDKNKLNGSIGRSWIAKKGEETSNGAIDTMAEELSEYGVPVTPEDIIQFIYDHPSNRLNKGNETTRALNERFKVLVKEITGEDVGGVDSSSGRLILAGIEAGRRTAEEQAALPFQGASIPDALINFIEHTGISPEDFDSFEEFNNFVEEKLQDGSFDYPFSEQDYAQVKTIINHGIEQERNWQDFSTRLEKAGSRRESQPTVFEDAAKEAGGNELQKIENEEVNETEAVYQSYVDSVNRLQSVAKGATPVIVVRNGDEYIQSLKDAGASNDVIDDARISLEDDGLVAYGGYVHSIDSIYLISENIPNKEELNNVWLHENIHRALDKLYGDDYVSELYNLYHSLGNEAIKQLVPKRYFEEFDKRSLYRLADEYLAFLSAELTRGQDVISYFENKGFDKIPDGVESFDIIKRCFNYISEYKDVKINSNIDGKEGYNEMEPSERGEGGDDVNVNNGIGKKRNAGEDERAGFNISSINDGNFRIEKEVPGRSNTRADNPANEASGRNVEGSASIKDAISSAEKDVDTNPTDAQKEVGNYKKGHVSVNGLNITIENPAGSVRSGKDASGKEWSVTMQNTYGYIRGTEGVDGDHIDVYLGSNPESGQVFVVDQVSPDSSFDEHKVMMGFDSVGEAEVAYLSNYETGWQGLGQITGVSLDAFKEWVDSSHRKTKRFADYKIVKANDVSQSEIPAVTEKVAVLTEGEYAERHSKEIINENPGINELTAYNQALDKYPSYVREYIKSGYLEKLYTESSISERIKLGKIVHAAGFETSEISGGISNVIGGSKYKKGDEITIRFNDGMYHKGIITKIDNKKISVLSNGRTYTVDNSRVIDNENEGIRFREVGDIGLTEIEKGALINNLNGLSNSVAENQNSLSDIKDTKLLSILQTEKEKITTEVENLSSNLNTTIHIIRDVNDIVDEAVGQQTKKRGSKGWYDPKTGEVYFVLPNAESVEDAQATILHEVVAHKGLRGLLGERFDEMLYKVFKGLPSEDKHYLSEDAYKSHKGDIRVPVEEYLARIAETDVVPSLWEKVKGVIKDFFRSSGVDLRMSDGDIRYMLWKSKNRIMKGDSLNIAVDKASQEMNLLNGVLFRDGGPSIQATPVKIDDIAKGLFNKSVMSSMFKYQEGYQDRMLSVEKLIEAVEKAKGEKIPDWQNAYLYENTLSSRSHIESMRFQEDMFKPILEVIGKLTEHESLENVHNYMFIKHGIERNSVFAHRDADVWQKKQISELDKNAKNYDKQVEEINEKSKIKLEKLLKKDYSGLTAIQEGLGEVNIDFFVEEFEKSNDTSELWRTVNAATADTLRKWYDCGMIDKSSYEYTSKMFKYYIPLRGFDETTAEDVFEYHTPKEGFANPMRKAKGRNSKAEDPIAHIAKMAESTILAGNKNVMKQHLLEMVRNNPSSLYTLSCVWYENIGTSSEPEWIEVAPKFDIDPKVFEENIRAHNERMKELEGQGFAVKSRKGLHLGLRIQPIHAKEHEIRVCSNGETFVIYMNTSPVVSNAVNGLNNPDAIDNKTMNGIRWVNRQMAANFTMRNPAFVLSNLSRDLIYSNTSLFIKEGVGYAIQFDKNIPIASGAIFRYLRGKSDMSNEADKLFKEFIDNGGETGYTATYNIDEYKKQIDKELKKIKGEVDPIKAFRVMAAAFSVCNRWAEDLTRFSTYMTSRQEGRSITRSIVDAKEVTVNFNRKGSGTKGSIAFKSLYIFFNASVQGLDNFAGLIKKHPRRAIPAIFSFAALGYLMPYLNSVLIGLIGGDDDDYNNLSDWVRQNNIVIPIGEGRFLFIPLSIELRAFYGTGEMIHQWSAGRMKDKNLAIEALVKFSELIPVDPAGSVKNIAGVFPTAAQPVVQAYINKDFTGKPIFKKNEWNKYLPAWRKAYAGTNKNIVASTEFMNAITGGDYATRGNIDLNPAIIEHLFEQYAGGVGKTINQGVKAVSSAFDDKEDLSLRNIPVINRFVGNTSEFGASSRINERYFHNIKLMDETASREREYLKSFREIGTEYFPKFNQFTGSKEYKKYLIIQQYSKEINELNKVIQQVDEKKSEELKNRQTLLKGQMLERIDSL